MSRLLCLVLAAALAAGTGGCCCANGSRPTKPDITPSMITDPLRPPPGN